MRKALLLFLTITMPIWLVPACVTYFTLFMFHNCYKGLDEAFTLWEKRNDE